MEWDRASIESNYAMSGALRKLGNTHVGQVQHVKSRILCAGGAVCALSCVVCVNLRSNHKLVLVHICNVESQVHEYFKKRQF